MNKLFRPFFALFIYFFKGARIDVALQKQNRSRTRTMYDYPKEDAKLVVIDGVQSYDMKDIMMGFQIEVHGLLILKNNSKYPAYNIELLNPSEVFSEFDLMPKLTSIAPNEKLEIKIMFRQFGDFESGIQADKLPDIPLEKQNKILKVKYENEAGTKLLTKFWVSFKEINNEYTYL